MRRSTFYFFCAITVFLSCDDNENEEEVVCSCAAQEFSIQFVDIDGNNLLTNGTYQPDNIIVTKKGFDTYTFYNESVEKFSFEMVGEAGDNDYEIQLNDSETDSLVLNLTKEGGSACCGPYFAINSAHYNTIELKIDRGNPNFVFDDGIVVVK